MFLIYIHRETSKFKQSVLTLVSPVSSTGIRNNNIIRITTTMTLYEDMKPIEHVLHHPICVLSHLMCVCKHCNIKLFLYYWTHWSFWWMYQVVKEGGQTHHHMDDWRSARSARSTCGVGFPLGYAMSWGYPLSSLPDLYFFWDFSYFLCYDNIFIIFIFLMSFRVSDIFHVFQCFFLFLIFFDYFPILELW